MNEEQRLGRRVAHLLSESASRVDPVVLERLHAARIEAVKARKQGAFDILPHRLDWGMLTDMLRPALTAVLVVAVFAAGDYFNKQHTLAQRSEVETALLADDLPIDAYLDQGFRAWLQSESRS